mmetsp:Transcript_11261/g.23499  ORF Transcript_11261/g.23499 Transcript_11261/m.23499 type:complete len:299 (+) Transcript_11261:172-1068(+)|eukprot:CAMPEP_0118952244 /NCGR_PEP_ID=MMETSP1169-20130426/54518_1 /TAXON_ID=36882 /ORGANISM="Pyramimonas obovata, Strain CCMP722" /LENGTH=298 /DNA_ID=CAMNT_0006899447 /DNA_START=169 /DNA_END=1065 /DNA_ORIENTATION=-
MRRVNPGSLGKHAEDWFETRGLKVTQKLSKKQNAELQICFEIFDADGSGSVEKDEVQDAMDMLGIPFSEKDIDELFLELDADGDESLTVEEFKVLILTQIHNKGPGGGASKVKGPKVDLQSFAQALQRRQHLENVTNLDPDTLSELVRLHNNGEKQIKKPSNTASRAGFEPNDVPVPLRYKPRSRHHHHISMTAFTSGISAATKSIETAPKVTMSRTIKGLGKSTTRTRSDPASAKMETSSTMVPSRLSRHSFPGFTPGSRPEGAEVYGSVVAAEPYRGVWSPQRGIRKSTLISSARI